MRQKFYDLKIYTNGQKLYDFTDQTIEWIKKNDFKNGMINLSIQHTSASLIVQENADPDVQKDLINYFNNLVPMDNKLYIHTTEGKDDMPAHIKSSITNNQISLSIKDGKLLLGTWQGIYLFEQIFKKNIKIIITSNTKISDLYKDGLQRDQFKPFINIMQSKSIEHELRIEEDYRRSKDNQKQRFFFPLNEENNFEINKFFRVITKNKKNFSKNLNIKGRIFEIKNFYEGISRFNFDELCDNNLGAEDYLEIVKNLKFMIIEKIPQFNDINSNQQQRFITLIDIIYDKNLPIAVTASQNIHEFTTSRSLEEPFKRTISRLYELTSMKYNI